MTALLILFALAVPTLVAGAVRAVLRHRAWVAATDSAIELAATGRVPADAELPVRVLAAWAVDSRGCVR